MVWSTNSGAVFVLRDANGGLGTPNYQRIGNSLVPSTRLNALVGNVNSLALSQDGAILAVGGYNYGSSLGTAWVYQLSVATNSYSLIAGPLGPLATDFYYGYAVSLSSDGSRMAVGAFGANAVYTYSITRNQPPSFTQVTITSNNPRDVALATRGDTITLTVTVDAAVTTVTATIAGKAAVCAPVTGTTLTYKCSVVVAINDPQGRVAFTVTATVSLRNHHYLG